MFKIKGNFDLATQEFKNDKNNAVSFVYENKNPIKGPLSGITVSIKDNFATKDAPTQASSKILEGFKPGYDAVVIKRLRDAGADFVGKTHLDELALGGTGTLSSFGIIKNPLDENRMVGGSSSGAAATLAENISIALGSDTGDSVRLPASFVGKVGFKPSYGAVPRYGLFAYASSLDTVGWMTHNVNDSICASQIMFGRDDKDMTSKDIEVPVSKSVKPKKVGILNMYEYISPEASSKMEQIISSLKKDGVEVEVVSMDKKLLEAVGDTYGIISYSEVTSNDSNLNGIAFGNRHGGDGWEEVMTNSRSEGFGPMVQRRLTLGSLFLKAKNQKEIFDKAKKVRRIIFNKFKEIQNSFDVLIYPATEIAPTFAEGKSKSIISSLLSTSNLTGNPSISIPFGTKEKMPFGLAIEGSLYEDKALLSNALYFEELIGGDYE